MFNGDRDSTNGAMECKLCGLPVILQSVPYYCNMCCSCHAQRDIGVVAANGGEYHLLNSATSRWSPADSHFGLGNRTIFVTVKKLLLPMMT